MLTTLHSENALTKEEKATFERQGYLKISEALSETEVKNIESNIDEIYQKFLLSGHDPYHKKAINPHLPFFYPDLLGTNSDFIELVDHAKTFPKVCGILGWNIYCYHTHFIVAPPIPENEEIPTHFHQDSGRVNSDIEVHPRPRLSIKVAYWLSNCSRPERGNLVVIPGSQNYDNLDELQDTMHAGTVSICGNPGDAVIFDRRLWHSSSPNKSNLTRKALFYGYGYRWLQPKDNMTISPETIKQYGPIRQQLLGVASDNNRRFTPLPDDVPLKAWMEKTKLLQT